MKTGPCKSALGMGLFRCDIHSRGWSTILWNLCGFLCKRKEEGWILLHNQALRRRKFETYFSLVLWKQGFYDKIPSCSSLVVFLILTPELALEPGERLRKMAWVIAWKGSREKNEDYNLRSLGNDWPEASNEGPVGGLKGSAAIAASSDSSWPFSLFPPIAWATPLLVRSTVSGIKNSGMLTRTSSMSASFIFESAERHSKALCKKEKWWCNKKKEEGCNHYQNPWWQHQLSPPLRRKKTGEREETCQRFEIKPYIKKEKEKKGNKITCLLLLLRMVGLYFGFPLLRLSTPSIGGTSPRFFLWRRRFFSYKHLLGWRNGRMFGSWLFRRNKVGIVFAPHLQSDRHLHGLLQNFVLSDQLGNGLTHQHLLSGAYINAATFHTDGPLLLSLTDKINNMLWDTNFT